VSPRRHAVALDAEGNLLPYSPAKVEAVVADATQHGELLCAVFRLPDASLAVQVVGEPSLVLAEALETVARSYRRALQTSGAPRA